MYVLYYSSWYINYAVILYKGLQTPTCVTPYTVWLHWYRGQNPMLHMFDVILKSQS